MKKRFFALGIELKNSSNFANSEGFWYLMNRPYWSLRWVVNFLVKTTLRVSKKTVYSMDKLSNQIISNLIQINAIKFNPASPFTWASGWKSPIYCDNRKILSYPDVRKAVCKGFCNIINEHFLGVDVIAGVATGAIAHGMLVAEELNLPFIYVRPEPKKHGLANQVEGESPKGKRVLVIEDLVSTGKSSLNAVKALQDAGCEILGMVAIFTYGFPQAEENFKREGVVLKTLGSYSELIEQGIVSGLIDRSQQEVLNQWRVDPENWGK